METEQRIYVNSYMMKTAGDDTSFQVDLGAQYSFNSIQLDTAVLENQFVNFYESWNQDFRVLGVTIAGTTYRITIDQHCTWQQLITLVNNNPVFSDALIVMVDVPLAYDNGRKILQCRFTRNAANVNATLIGGAWEKMGFNTGISTAVQSGVRCYDLSQSPSIMVAFENIPNVMKTKYGQYSFVIPNSTSFGSRIFYTNTQETTCQRVILPYEVTVDRLQMRLLNCDLKKLETAAQGSKKNEQGIECIFVFTLRNSKS